MKKYHNGQVTVEDINEKNNSKNKQQSSSDWINDIFVPFANPNNIKNQKDIISSISVFYQSIFNSEWRGAKRIINKIQKQKTKTTDTINELNKLNAFVNYYESLPVKILNFFGVPLIISNGEEKLTFVLLLRNLFGLRAKNAPTWQKTLAIIFLPLSLAWNLLQIVSKTAWNIVTLFTEFFPGLIEILCEKALKKILDSINDKNNNFGKKLGLGILGTFLMIPFLSAKLFRILGRTITSPLESMNAALEKGRKLDGIGGEFVARLLQGISLALTITAYSILLPLAAKAIITKAPTFLSKVTEIMPNWMHTGISRILPEVKGLGNIVMKAIGPVVNPTLKILGLGTENSLLVTVSTGVSTLVATAGVYSKHLGQKVRHWWTNIHKNESIKNNPTASRANQKTDQEIKIREESNAKKVVKPLDEAVDRRNQLSTKIGYVKRFISDAWNALKELFRFRDSTITMGPPPFDYDEDEKEYTSETIFGNN